MKLKKSTLTLCMFILCVNFVKAQDPSKFIDQRDGEAYATVKINDLLWLKENLHYRSSTQMDTLISLGNCNVFYSFADAQMACPEGWRLPTAKEVKTLIKGDRRGRIDLTDTLAIELCGRIDYEHHTKPGIQNTFWLNEEMSDGHVVHWHTFGNDHEIHKHDVMVARRKFPVRCVCEVEKE